ncbi:MAG: glycosyltransferase [Vicinamibacterales bacterium]|jgi:spore maturation protein CgeB
MDPPTLRAAKRIAPGAIFVDYQTDNPFGNRTREAKLWGKFIASIPEYDIHFVFRPHDISAYRASGATDVYLTRHHYYPALHAPPAQATETADYQHEVLFIGTAIDRRVDAIARLLASASVQVDVYGGLWNRHIVYYRHRRHFHGNVHESQYAALVAKSKICLGFVSASNRDDYTGRSIEIPACGGFLLAERTEKHRELYAEGREAAFFGSSDECLEKIRYYLSHDEERRAIADAGTRRCLASGNSCVEVMSDALAQIEIVSSGIADEGGRR